MKQIVLASLIWCIVRAEQSNEDVENIILPISASSTELLNAPIPRLWPPWLLSENQAVRSATQWKELLDETRRIYFTMPFTKSTFEPTCAKQHQIEIVYFNPYERVTLSCRLCRLIETRNGLPKYWKVLPWYDIEDIFAFSSWKTDRKLMDKFKFVADWELSRNNVPSARTMRQPPLPGKNAGYPPPPKFFQKNGKLLIINPNSNAQGIYTCMGQSSTSESHYLYVVLARTPIIGMTASSSCDLTANKPICDNAVLRHVKGDWPLGSRPLIDKNKRQLYTSHSHWHHLMIPFALTGEKCPSVVNERSQQVEGRLYFDDNENYECKSWYGTYTSEKSIVNMKHQVQFQGKKFNLAIAFEWEPWSECNACAPVTGTRTRTGRCKLIKLDKNKDYIIHQFHRPNLTNDNLKVNCMIAWLESLNNFLSSGSLFENGIPLDSAFLIWLAFKHSNKPDLQMAFSRDLDKMLDKEGLLMDQKSREKFRWQIFYQPTKKPYKGFPTAQPVYCWRSGNKIIPIDTEYIVFHSLFEDFYHNLNNKEPDMLGCLGGHLSSKEFDDLHNSYRTVGHFTKQESCSASENSVLCKRKIDSAAKHFSDF